MPVAFFDLDKTILSINSASLWLKAEVRDGRLSRWNVVQATWWLLNYHLGKTSLDSAIRKSVQTLTGQPEDELAQRVEAFYHREIKAHIRSDARAAIQTHADQQHARVLLTSASPYLAQAVTQDLGLDGYLCTRFAVDDSARFTGELVEPACFGEGKIHWAQNYLSQRSEDLQSAYFYTDSRSDLPMLLACGNPRVVTPDPRLRREAARRNWPILEWR